MANKSIFLTIDVETGKAVKSVADIRKLIKEMTDDLVRLKAQGKGVGDAEFDKLEAKIKSAKKELQSFQDSLKETPTFTQKIQKGFEESFLKIGAAIGAAFAIGKVIEFGQASLKVASEVEKNEARLLTALNGRKAVQQELIRQANELEKSSGIDDRAIVEQQTFLALQGRTQEQISKTIEAAIRLSKVTGEDLGSAVQKLDATFEGSVGKLGKLDEGFSNLTETQLKAGSAIDLINEKYANTLNLQTASEKAANDFSNSIEDLEKAFGKLLLKLAPVASGLAGILSELVELTKTEAEKRTEETAAKIAAVEQNALRDFQATRQAYLDAGKTAEQALTLATKDEVLVRQTLFKQALAAGESERAILYFKQITALKDNMLSELAVIRANEQAKTEAEKKAATERQKDLEKINSDRLKKEEEARKLEAEAFKALQDENIKAANDAYKIQVADLKKNEQEKILTLKQNYLAKGDFSQDAENKLKQAIIQVKIDTIEQEKKLNEDNKEFVAQKDTEILQLKQQSADQEVSIEEDKNKKLLEKKKEQLEKEKLIIQTSIQATADLLIAASQIQTEVQRQETQKRIDLINEELNAQLSAIDIAEQRERGTYVEKDAIARKYDAQRKAARDKAAAEERKLKVEQFKKDKQAAVIQNLINTALAITNALAYGGAAAPGLAIAAGIAGAAQTAIILGQPIPQFNKGGIIRGKSHAEGGVPAIVGGTTPIELEGGEAIINKRAVQNPLIRQMLSNINSSTGGVPFAYGGIPTNTTSSFEQGGIATRLMQSDINVNNTIDFAALENFFNQKLNQPIRSYVVEQDITSVQNINRKIESRATLS